MSAISGSKSGYHHGDLRNALIAAAVELASDGGPEKVVLREAARRVGVSPTAAYRHFASQGELLRAVKAHGQQVLADTMERAAAASPPTADPGESAELRLKAIGRGYIGFALGRPGLFRTAFCNPHFTGEDEEHEEWAGVTRAGPGPEYRSFALLTEVLDALADAGRLSAINRPASEAAAWAGVHGLSLLMLDGPMRRLPEDAREAVIERTLTVMVAGVVAP